MNVLFELETDGDEDIWTQELKLSEDTWRVPEQEVSDVFVVTLEELISLEKVTEIDVFMEIDETPSEGMREETIG